MNHPNLLPYANGSDNHSGKRACINSNGSNVLPWTIYLDTVDGWQPLCDSGSYDAAYDEFNRRNLVPTTNK